jgi:hypothetical protein
MKGTTLYGLALFLPSIVNQLGFTATTAQLLSAGPFVTGFSVCVLSIKSSKSNESTLAQLHWIRHLFMSVLSSLRLSPLA